MITSKAEFVPNKAISSIIRFEHNDMVDNAQYMSLLFLETFKIKLDNNDSSEPLKFPVNKSKLEKVFIEGKGILLGSTNGMFGEVEYYLNGVPRIFTPKGEMITSPNSFEKQLVNNSLLNYDTKAYIQPKNELNEDKYYGIFYSLKDAIKIVSENDFIKIGEITS